MIYFTLPQTASSQITVTSTATKITKLIDPNVEENNSIPSDLDAINIYVESGSARYLINEIPTSSEGLILESGKTYFLRGMFLKDFNIISSDDAVLTVMIGKTEYGEFSMIPSEGSGESVWEDDGTDVTPKNSRNVAIPEDKAIISNNEKGEPVVSENKISNSELTNWEIYPNDWDTEIFNLPIRSEDADTGTYALQFPEPSGKNTPEVSQVLTVVAEDEYTPTLRVKDGTVVFAVYYANGENNYYYQFSGDNIGTWQQSGLEPESAYNCVGGEGVYATCSPTAFTIPAGVTELNLRLLSVNEAKLDNVSIVDGEANDVVTNGGFENWKEVFPTGFIATDLDDEGGDGECVKEDADFHSTPYSAKIVQGTESQSFVFLGILSGLTEGTTGRISFWAKEGTASSFKMMLWNGLEDGEIYMFSGDNAGEWLPLDEGLFEDPNAYTEITLSDEWEQYTIEAPENGQYLIPVFFANETAGSTYYLDDIEGFEIQPEILTYHTLKIRDTATVTTTNDTLLDIKSSDDYSLFKVGARGKITSEVVKYWDFNNKQVKVGADTSPSNILQESALNGFSGAKYQALVEIDLKEVGNTILSLSRENYRFVPMMIISETTAADNLSGDADVYLADEDGPMMGITYSTSLGKSRSSSFGSDFEIGAVGQDLSVRVDTVDSGTSGTLKIYIIGFFIFDQE